MKKIGFIDYYLDEWHANQYPQWIKQDSSLFHRDCEVVYAWAETERDGDLNTADWCKKHGVHQVSSIESLVEKSDYIVVLSPDHPEHHEKLSRLPLMSGKPVYIDKTFAPNLQAAIRMFELAEKHNTPLFSSSALRFSKEFKEDPNSLANKNSIEFMATSGPGLYTNYAVHQFEIIVSHMGIGARRMKSLSTKHGVLLIIQYVDGRQATMTQLQQESFQVSLLLDSGQNIHIPACTDFFERFIHEMLNFFETGKVPVDKEETLEIMALIDAGYQAMNNNDRWIDI